MEQECTTKNCIEHKTCVKKHMERLLEEDKILKKEINELYQKIPKLKYRKDEITSLYESLHKTYYSLF